MTQRLRKVRIVQMQLASIHGLTKSFSGVVVVDDFNLDIQGGDLWGLIGSNGSGKSTVVKMLSGFYRPDVDGGVDLAPGCRMVFVHQDLGLVNELNVMENIALSAGFMTRPFRGIDWRGQRSSAEETLAELDLDFGPDELVGSLAPSQKSLVAIARAVHHSHSGRFEDESARRVLVLDEPTASLTEQDASLVGDKLVSIAGRGEAVVMVTHRLAEIQRYTNKVCIMRDGRVVTRGQTESMSEQDMMNDMLGSKGVGRERLSVSSMTRAREEVILEARELTGTVLKPISLSIRRGEIVGVTGLNGCGKSELGRLIAGAQAAVGGTVEVSGVPVATGHVRASMSHGVGYIPENRRENSVVLGLTASENVVLPSLVLAGMRSLSSKPKDARETESWMDALDVTPRAATADIDIFSGGNQQKLTFAKWLMIQPTVLVLDEPTQAVDVGASEDIYALLRTQATDGTAVLLISSEWPDMCKICDRVIVLDRGSVVQELFGPNLDETSIARACHATPEPQQIGGATHV